MRDMGRVGFHGNFRTSGCNDWLQYVSLSGDKVAIS